MIVAWDVERSSWVTDNTGTKCPFGSTYGVEDVVGDALGEMSKLVWLDPHDRRNPGEKNTPDGAESGPGEMAIIFPVLARCMLISVSGGRGAVRGVLDPDALSLSKGECLLVPVEIPVDRPADLLGIPNP